MEEGYRRNQCVRAGGGGNVIVIVAGGESVEGPQRKRLKNQLVREKIRVTSG